MTSKTLTNTKLSKEVMGHRYDHQLRERKKTEELKALQDRLETKNKKLLPLQSRQLGNIYNIYIKQYRPSQPTAGQRIDNAFSSIDVSPRDPIKGASSR